MTVSIAMATYNGEEYISEQLQSFCQQTLLPSELVICDDGSTDRTITIIEDFAEQAPFPVSLYKSSERLGYVRNFDKALSKATGDIVFLSDQDDVWWPEKLSEIVGAFENDKAASLFINDAELADGKLNPTGLTALGQLRSAQLPPNDFVLGCCCAVRRNFLDLALPIPANHRSHDAWLVKIAQALDEYRLLDKPLQYYRRHGGNASMFIANRLTRVTKYTLYLDVLKSGLNRSASRTLELSHEANLLLNRLEFILPKLEDNRAHHVQHYIADLKPLIRIYLKREAIRKAAAPKRVILAVVQYLNGGYGKSSGFKSMLRDFLG